MVQLSVERLLLESSAPQKINLLISKLEVKTASTYMQMSSNWYKLKALLLNGNLHLEFSLND